MSVIETPLGRYDFVNPSEYIAQAVARDGSWELDIVHSLFDALNGRAFGLDVGANVGVFSVQVAMLAKQRGLPVRIDAFEVQPDTFANLQRHIELNDLQDIVRPHNKAVGSAPGRMEFDVIDTASAYAAGCFSLVPGVHEHFNLDIPIKGRASTDVVTLDAYAEGGVDFIKVDVEGMELEILKAAEPILRRWQPVILTEIWAPEKADWYRDQALELLTLLRSIYPKQKQMGENWMFWV